MPTMPAIIRRTSRVWASDDPPEVTRPRRGGDGRTRVRAVRGGSSSSSKKDKFVSSGGPASFNVTGGSEGTAQMRRTGCLMETTDELTVAVDAELLLGRYRLGNRLGSGGFGTVYAATDERLERPVAVKVIPGSPAQGERGRREALAAGRLDHPGVVAVFDAGEDGRARYLISELVHGRTRDELSAEGVLSDRDILRIGLALCGALEHA